MKRVKRASEIAVEARRRNMEQLAVLGGLVRGSRIRRRWTQKEVAHRAGISRSSVSALERGFGGGQSLDTWQRVSIAVGTPLIATLQRDPMEDTVDAGHLAMQELVLRLGRGAGYARSFELVTKPAEPWRSTDVGLRDDRRRVLVLGECWNSVGDVGAGVRSTTRKVAEAEQYAVAMWGDRPHRVASVWIVRATKRNRELVARYPEVFATRFPGSSRGWVAAPTTGGDPPAEPGLVRADGGATRLFAWRRRTAR